METIKKHKGTSRELCWKVNTVQLLHEICNNPGTGALKVPLNIFKNMLADVAERATKLNDPILNELMIDLNLYELPPMDSKERRPIVEKVRYLAAIEKSKTK